MKLRQVASMIMNSTLPHITNTNISIEQIEDEVLVTGYRIIEELLRAGKQIDTSVLYLEVGCIKLECKDISNCCNFNSDEKVLVAKIPMLLTLVNTPSLLYVGLVDKSREFKIVYNNNYLYTKYSKYTGNIPTAWYRNSTNEIIIFNPPTFDLKMISVAGLFNPRELLEYECDCLDNNDIELPFPDGIVSMILDRMLNYYTKISNIGHLQPNTQSEIIKTKI